MARPPLLLLIIIVPFIFLQTQIVIWAAEAAASSSSSSSFSDAQALLKFKGSIETNNDALLASWAENSAPCSGEKANWVGILCENGSVWGLILENMGLKGHIDVESLEGLPLLRSISFKNNNFEGSIPDVKRLGALKSLYLSQNRFSGEIPGDKFSGMLSLKKVHLEQNQFEGAIPWSLAELPKLLELRLEGNRFVGELPNFQQKTLKFFNISNNEQLQGPIPQGLSQMDPTSFLGDENLCGEPLNKPCNNAKKPSIASIILASMAVAIALVVLGVVIFIWNRKNKPLPSIENPPYNIQQNKPAGVDESDQAAAAMAGGSRSPDRGSSHGSANGKRTSDGMKLSFVKEGAERFDLPDLLKASAEILGSGCFGSSYKAALSSGLVMVVKRFKQMNNVGREEFQQHMRRIGRLRHPNLLPLVAYYYKKEEKLLITDHVEKGSLAVRLHGHQTLGQSPLDWPTRLKIIKGVAKGLRYLYNELQSLVVSPHGHLKSSNVLLKASYEPLLSDYGLIPVVNQEHAQELMVAYKSPEYLQLGRITRKTDVWSFGLLILEILTGKFPATFLHQSKEGDEEDLPSWVKSIPQQEWSNQVFDKDMGPTKNSEGEIQKLIRIGLACCESDFEKRPDLQEAVEKIEELKEKDGDEDFYSSYASEADIRSSRGLSDDFSITI